jgi:hypothetical protein
LVSLTWAAAEEPSKPKRNFSSGTCAEAQITLRANDRLNLVHIKVFIPFAPAREQLPARANLNTAREIMTRRIKMSE